MKLFFVVFFTVLSFLVLQVNAQEKEILTNDKVIKMSQAKLDRTLIVNSILACEPNFDISPDGLIQLKNGKVKTDIIALIQKVQTAKNRPKKSADSNKSNSEKNNKETPSNKSISISWTEMPLVKGKPIARPDTEVFGEKYSDSIYVSTERVGWRTAQNFQKIILKVGVQDNREDKGEKEFSIRDNNGTLYTATVKPNSRPLIIELNISKSDVVGFVIHDFDGYYTSDFVRFMDVIFIPK